MPSLVNPENTTSKSFNFLRTLALVAVFIATAVSLGLMFNAGHPPVFLMVLFAGWVFSPFMALLVVDAVSKRWSVLAHVTVYCLMLVITLGSLVSYSGVLSSPGTKPAALFLIVPLISWLLIAIVLLLARRGPQESDGV